MRSFTLLFAVGLVACASSSSGPGANSSAKSPAPAQEEECVATVTPTPSSATDQPPAAFVLRPGDIVCLVKNGEAWTAVSSAAGLAPHLTLKMTAQQGNTLLGVANATSSTLTYRALMKVPGQTWQETSIMPVMKGLFGYEHWPHPIEALAVFALRSQ